MSNVHLSSKRSKPKQLIKDVSSGDHVASVDFGSVENEVAYPSPAPPIKSKSEIFNSSQFAYIEQHVKESPSDVANDYSTLLEYILDGTADDLGKLRAIYCWVVQQKVPLLLRIKDVPPLNTPVGYLHAIRMQKGTYAILFAQLCRRAGLPCVVIYGVAKGVSYNVGDTIDPSSMNNSWNAVFVDGNWRFVHPHWSVVQPKSYDTGMWTIVDGEQYHTGDKKEAKSIATPINESYFLTNPETFVHKCLPNDPKWQLLDNPISISDFENNLFLQPCFEELGLKIVKPHSCKFVCIDGQVEIVIKIPNMGLRFSYKLLRKRNINDEGEYEYPLLNRFVLHYYIKNATIFEIRFPPQFIGTYKIQIFCIDMNSNIQNTPMWVCDFCIICESGMDECVPLPLVPEIGWGVKDEILGKHGMKAVTAKLGKMSIDESLITELKFTVPHDVDIHAELCQYVETNSELSNYVKVNRNNTEVTVKIKPPKEGEYILQIFCKDSGVLMYENVCNYVLQRTQIVEDPKLAETRKRLKEALNNGSPDVLRAAMTEFQTNGLQDKGDFTKAKRKLQLARINKEIREAIAAKDLEKLDKTMHNLSETSLKKDLGDLYLNAEDVRSRLRKLKRLRHAVLDMDQKTISELRSYPQPPKAVHGIMAATFLLLGHKEVDLKKWPKIQGLISKKGKEGLKRKVANINMKKVKAVSLKQAKHILSKYDLESVQIASSGAATFYQWATSMINELDPEVTQK